MLEQFGLNLNDPGVRDTPARVSRMYGELLSGYLEDPATHCKTFDGSGFRDLVTVAHIRFFSLCEHHLIPFFGTVAIGYVPDGRVLGLSKFSRVVDVLSRRLQTQERLTHEVAEAIWTNARPDGLIVQVAADHLCIAMRGIRRPGSVTTTSEVRGTLTRDRVQLERFYETVRGSHAS